MMTTIACPEALLDAMRHLSMVQLGPGVNVVRVPNCTDGTTSYGCASLPVDYLAGWDQPLSRPAWDTDEIIDMTAAATAQAAIQRLTPETLGDREAGRVWAVTGPVPLDAIAAMGLTPIGGET